MNDQDYIEGKRLVANALEFEGGAPRGEGLWFELERLGCDG